MLDACAVDGKRPWFVADVEVRQVFSHCGKAFLRGNLWQPESWPEPDDGQEPEPDASPARPRRNDGANPTYGARSRTAYRPGLYGEPPEEGTP